MLKRHCIRKYRVTCLFFIISIAAFGQGIRTEHLETSLKQQRGTPKVSTLNTLSVAYSTPSKDKAIFNANQAYAQAVAIGDTEREIESLRGHPH